MIEQEPYWHTKVHQVMPDIEIVNCELHHEGLVNDVLIINNEWVFRFTKTAWGKELMEMETCLLRYLQSNISMPVPSPIKWGDGFLVYPLLAGKTFLRKVWLEQISKMQQSFADELGKFLNELHHVNISGLDWEMPLTLAPITRDTWLDIFERIVNKIYPLLLPHQIDWVENLFEPVMKDAEFFNFKYSLVHGDLSPYHILYAPEEMHLSGVIDFGVAGLGDPATDLGSLISYYGEGLISKLDNTYRIFPDLLRRARFYAKAIELQWVLIGIESREDYWFTAHLGNARDIGDISLN
jgi:aminoglycoside 2''-phosphotransferase